MNYKDSGVDVALGDKLSAESLSRAKRINNFAEDGALSNGVPYLTAKCFGSKMFVATDGVGTKIKFAQQFNMHRGIGIDVVAMVVNDLWRYGADPVGVSIYFTTNKLDSSIYGEVMSGVEYACRYANISLLGGETSEKPTSDIMPDMYDIAATAIGFTDNPIDPENIEEDDVIIGIPSSGLHSNGYSLVSKVLEDYVINDELMNQLMIPTQIYKSLQKLKQQYINGIAHITGGGLIGKIEKILPDSLQAVIHPDWSVETDIFDKIKYIGDIDNETMYRTFNMGIGIAIFVPEYNVNYILEHIIGSVVIGEVRKRNPEKVIIKW